MKKIFTLLFTAAILTSAFAQYDSKDEWGKNGNDDVFAKNGNDKHDKDGGGYGSYYFTPRERDMQIAQINREYEYRIQSVRNKFFMSWYQKKCQIEVLKDQREREIRMVYAKFNDRRNRYNDRGYDKRKNW